MYLHQQDPDNYVACHCLTGKVRCRACGGIGCSLCCMYGGYSRCPDCDGTRSVFRPRHRNRDPGPDPPPPSPSADPFTFDEALAGADDRRNDTIGWLRRSEWFYEDYKRTMIEWLGALDLTAPTAEAVLNHCAAGMTADHPLARELKERVRSLSFACFTVQTMKQRT